MRSLPFLITGLFVTAPALAQEEADTAETKDASAETKEAEKAEAPKDAPAAEAKAAATVQLGSTNAAKSEAEGAAVAAPAAKTSPSQRGATSASDDSWKFEFHGYLRAPMRVGMGHRDTTLPGQSASTLHYPVIPDDQYLSWQFTSHNKKDWAEIFFSYGNSWAKGTVALQGFNFTDAAWTDSPAQFGISQGFVTLTPDLGFENVRLEAKAGSFWGRYGMAGRWDSGEYDTYVMGRTHVMGEALHLEIDLDDANTLWLEHGIGTKRPDPNFNNNARFTLLNHAHAGFRLGSDIEISAHYMHAWAQEEDRIMRKTNTYDGTALLDPYNAPTYPTSVHGVPDGKLWVAGIDARMELGPVGFVYLGYSHIGARDAIVVAPALEVLHGYGGGQFTLGVTDNYFGPSCKASNNSPYENKELVGGYPGPLASECSRGTGSVNSIVGQWDFSLTNFTQQIGGGQRFWGDGQDLRAVLYGMVNFVNSDSHLKGKNGVEIFQDNMKLKYGIDLQYQALPWLTIAARADRVQPNKNVPEQSFSVVSPRLIFKSNWNTHEQISISYSRYFYNQRDCEAGANPAYVVTKPEMSLPGSYGAHQYTPNQFYCIQPPSSSPSDEGYGSHYEKQSAGLRGAPTTRPDVNVIKVEASMWW
ncbi:MAG TPA: hypothetical protein VFQ61_37875 [Polyangiaceae bacterium]|nr:hypothetical protein [Polyangiaceae bacterium]